MKLAAAAFALTLSFLSSFAQAAEWTPEKWTAEDTLQFRTNCDDEGEHWSFVWVVVLDGNVWVRLGSRAGGRADCNKDKPFTSVKIGGEEFAKVEMVNTPEMATRVSDAMAAKYWTDIAEIGRAHV